MNETLVSHEDRMRATIQNRVEEARDSVKDGSSYARALERMLRRFAIHCLENLPTVLVLTELEQHDDFGKEARTAERAQAMDELSSFISEGQLRGHFRATEPRMAASVLINGMADLPYEIRGWHGVDRSAFVREWPCLLANTIAKWDENDETFEPI